MNKVLIIQPCIPHYREALFRKLLSTNEFKFEVWASKETVKLTSIDSFDDRIKYPLKEFSFGPFIYQENINYRKIHEFDKVVIVGNPRYLSNIIVFLICKIRGVKIIWWGQGWSQKTTKLSYFIRKILMKFHDSVLLYTEKEAEKMKLEKLTHKNIYYLNNGLDLDTILEYRIPNNLYNNCLNLVFIGRLTEKANLDLLFEALARVSFKYKLNIVGDGNSYIDLVKTAEILGVNNNISWHGSITCESSIAKIMNISHFFVYPGSVGLSLIHAFSYGIPALIYSDMTTHMPEHCAFTDYKTGITFEKGRVSSLTNALFLANEICLNGDNKKFGDEALDIVTKKYNVNVMAANFIKCLRS